MSDPARPSNAPEACVGPASEEAGKASACAGCPNQSACASGAGRQEDPAIAQVQERMRDIKHKILILSGKGGVGKSTVSAQLAWTLASQGYSVGLLDIDICGPSAPRMLGVENHEVRKSNFGWSPVYASENLAVMSVAFMLAGRNDAIIWRGPRKNGLIKQFLTDVEWGELDFLLVDAPPGTSDEHISIAQYLTKSGIDGAVIVTTPQEMALLDVRKEISFAHKVGVPVLGVVENMAGFACPSCSATSDIFPAVTGGARAMSTEMKVDFLGSLPLDPNLLQACEDGKCFIDTYPHSAAVQPLKELVNKLLSSTPSLSATLAAHKADSDMSDDASPAPPAAASATNGAAPSASALVSSFVSAFNRGDASALEGVFSSDARFVTLTGESLVGRPAVVSGLGALLAGRMQGLSLSALSVDATRITDDVTLLTATLERTHPLTAPDASLPSGRTLLTATARRERAQEGWRIVAAVDVALQQ